ncbi:MAG: hypothetical protein AB2A00_00010 [Myxococcota bacterium]
MERGLAPRILEQHGMDTQGLTGRVVFFGENDGNARLALAVAHALHAVAPVVAPVFVDVSAWYPGCAPGTEVFREAGFSSAQLPPPQPGAEEEDLVQALHAALQGEQPDVVVIPHELGYAAWLLELCRRFHVPTFEIQHGEYIPEYFSRDPVVVEARMAPPDLALDLLEREKWLAGTQARVLRDLVLGGRSMVRRARASVRRRVTTHPALHPLVKETVAAGCSPGYRFRATRVGVAGDYIRRRLVDMGMEDSRIQVTGYLRADEFHAHQVLPYAELCARYGLDPSRPTAVYFFSPVEEGYLVARDPILAVQDAHDALERVQPGWNFLVLNHPRLPDSRLSPITSSRPRIRVGRGGALNWSLMVHAGLVLGIASSTLTEALLAKRPVVTQNYALCNVANGLLVELQAVVPVFHRVHFEEQLARALTDTPFITRVLANLEHAARELLGPFDGRAGARTAEGILSLLREKGRATWFTPASHSSAVDVAPRS